MESSAINLSNLNVINSTCSYYLLAAITFQFVALITYVKYPNLDLITKSEKEKKAEKREI